MLSQDESRVRGVAFLRRLVVEELAVPNLLLRLPVHNEPLLDRAAKRDLAEVFAFVELGADECFPVAVAGDAVGDDARFVVGREARFYGVCAIVNHQRPRRRRWP